MYITIKSIKKTLGKFIEMTDGAYTKEEMLKMENEILKKLNFYVVYPNTDDFYNQDMQFASALDKKKNDIINMILENPEEAGRVITSYLKE